MIQKEKKNWKKEKEHVKWKTSAIKLMQIRLTIGKLATP